MICGMLLSQFCVGQLSGRGRFGLNTNPFKLYCRTLSTKSDQSRNNENVNLEILKALERQNKILKKIEGILGRIERQGKGALPSKGGRDKKPPLIFVDGSWSFRQGNGRYGSVSEDGTIFYGDNVHEQYPNGTSSFRRRTIRPDHNWAVERVDNASISELCFNGNSKLAGNSGTYSLRLRYNEGRASPGERCASVILGEIEFRSDGVADAEGTDWDRLLSNQRQSQLPYAHGARGEPTWLSRKLCEPWEDGDELNFIIDTKDNTVVFQKNGLPKKVLQNVLAFTNNRVYPEFLRVYAYSLANSMESNPPEKIETLVYEGPCISNTVFAPSFTIRNHE